MNLSRFGFERRPFPNTLDTALYYPATSQELALARMKQAFEEEEGVVVLTGEAGTGKTLLCHCFVQRYTAGTVTAFLTNSHVSSRKDLLQAILFDLSLPYENATEQELRLRLTDFVLNNYSDGKQTLVIVDEAQNLSVECLEELRLLSNLEAGMGKALQILLVAQPSLLLRLQQPELQALRHRVAVRMALMPLTLAESVDYVVHHLRNAGGQPDGLFSEEALELLANASAGVPRVLGRMARHSLRMADEMELECIDAEVVYEVIAEESPTSSDIGDSITPEQDAKETLVTEEENYEESLSEGDFSDEDDAADIHTTPGKTGDAHSADTEIMLPPIPEEAWEDDLQGDKNSLLYQLFDPPKRSA